MDVDRIATRLNPLVAKILRSPLHPLLSPGLMLIEYSGRRSGRHYEAVETSFRRLPRLAGQFGITYDRERGLTPEQCRALAEEGAVVKIALRGVSR